MVKAVEVKEETEAEVEREREMEIEEEGANRRRDIAIMQRLQAFLMLNSINCDRLVLFFLSHSE